MAYMNQERKAMIAAELKKVIPREWKWSLAVHHHSTIILTISEAPVDLLGEYNRHCAASWDRHNMAGYTPSDYAQLNEYHLDNQFSGDLLKTFEAIKTAMNVGNHNRSDIMTDYFDVGWYVSICLGHWDKPFRYVPVVDHAPGSAAYESLKAQIAALQATA